MCLFCTPIHCTPLPKQNSHKSYRQHFYTLMNGHKEQKNDRRGPAQRCTETLALTHLLCQIMVGSRSSCCWLQEKFEMAPFTKSGAESGQAAGVGRGRRWPYTKRKAHFDRSEWNWLPTHPADLQQHREGWGWGGSKVEEEAFKVDASHISHSTKESLRSAIWM